MKISGTNHFVNISSAVNYYAKQSVGILEIKDKILNKEIIISQPATKEGETIFLNTEEGRYFIGTK